VYGSNQATIQRYLALPSIRHAQFAMLWNFLGTLSILLFGCLCGFVAYAFYFGCDPFLSRKITRYDQLLPYFVMDLLKNFNGLPGLFIACVYSASLSTVSSGINSLVAVFLHDFIYPFHENKNSPKKKLDQKKSMILSKILGKIKFFKSISHFVNKKKLNF
jgi:Na+/proline symporter